MIQVDTGYNSTADGAPAVFTTPVAQLNVDHKYKCLSFFYKRNYSYDSEGSYRLDVSVYYPESGESVTTEVTMFIPYVWQEVNIKVDSSKYSTAEVSIKATHIHGTIRNPIAIDDISLLTTDCIGNPIFYEFCIFISFSQK